MATKLESQFVHDVLKPRLQAEFPGGKLIKQDPNVSFQGIPDYLFLYEGRWAALETKRARKSQREENQEYHVNALNEMSYAAFVHPGNLEEVMDDLQAALRPGR